MKSQPCALAQSGCRASNDQTEFFSQLQHRDFNKMMQRLLRSRVLPSYRVFSGRGLVTRRTLIAAPKPGDGPLMSRRADRELPGIIYFSKFLSPQTAN